jgi:membrane protease YdiL (CAAX protease family)
VPRQERWWHRVVRDDGVQIVAFAAVYALAALPLGSSLLVLCAFLCGVVWGGLRSATGSLVVPILTHVIWDLGVLVVWPLVPSP